MPRLTRQEISGSLGDLGTFIPLLVGMSVTNGLDFTAALLFSGIFNIVTGIRFGIPMAVQPMKAIAAIAIESGAPVPQILAAGICTGAVVLVLGVSGLIEWFNRVIPGPVVRGLQLGLGLILLGKGVSLIADTGLLWGWDSVAIGVGGATLAAVMMRARAFPTALVLFGVGLIAACCAHPDVMGKLRLGLYFPAFVPLAVADFRTGFLDMGIAQIPLTVLNSVIAVCSLSANLFPERPARTRPVSISVGIMNLVGCWFGGMPVCHGSGGLAGQYRFGARTSASIIFLGAIKVILAVLLGGSLLSVLRVYPHAILGVLLGISGLELASAARDENERIPVMVMLATAGIIIAFKSTVAGFVVGWIFALLVDVVGPKESSGD